MLHREAARAVLPHRVPGILLALLITLFCLTTVLPAHSQTYKVIHNFTNQGSDGATPYGGPVLDKQGNLYGATYLGGLFGGGSVYRLSPSGSEWTYTSLYSFKNIPDGSGPGFGTLVIGADRALFGTTEGGGYFGTAWAVCDCPKREYVLHSFGMGTDGAQPIGGLVIDPKGNLYGTTSEFGANGFGNVFELSPSGNKVKETILYSFTADNDPINPAAGVTLDAKGNIFGTASLGGANGLGAVYELTPSASGWTETILHNFQGDSDGANPVGGVVIDKAGNVFGTTFDGGINGGGTIYELSPSSSGWTFTTIYSLIGGYSGPYNKLTLDGKGNIYGFTNSAGLNGLGSIFKLSPGTGGWNFTDLYDFVGGNDGGLPYGSVAVDANGNVFGTAVVGGTDNQGVVFEITP
jgi:uncharacterized repeat protein (TIGR03803 family)